ncbi:hypothetical protein SAMN05444172_2608 [Burkholderia sp. GAS332]|nr:hypothetical protein SAMN05444172_2608 [Burkholderia sp. GAS332]
MMDTQNIVSELLGTGLTQVELAALAGCSQPTISAFRLGARGKRVSKEIGDRLAALHAERCRREQKAGSPPIPQTAEAGETA